MKERIKEDIKMFQYFLLKSKVVLFNILSIAFAVVTWIDVYCILTRNPVFGIYRESFGYAIADFITCLVLSYLRDSAGCELYDVMENAGYYASLPLEEDERGNKDEN